MWPIAYQLDRITQDRILLTVVFIVDLTVANDDRSWIRNNGSGIGQSRGRGVKTGWNLVGFSLILSSVVSLNACGQSVQDKI